MAAVVHLGLNNYVNTTIHESFIETLNKKYIVKAPGHITDVFPTLQSLFEELLKRFYNNTRIPDGVEDTPALRLAIFIITICLLGNIPITLVGMTNQKAFKIVRNNLTDDNQPWRTHFWTMLRYPGPIHKIHGTNLVTPSDVQELFDRPSTCLFHEVGMVIVKDAGQLTNESMQVVSQHIKIIESSDYNDMAQTLVILSNTTSLALAKYIHIRDQTLFLK
ncbi:hypothetical protein SAMD00019534_016000 [Acytostelium subglobosum LB1]|uniref:hypothetical protein n=1 Tax=Acytostelium subglobosum LB1 TaxID=1410327 RepID=UPI000644DD10|nr:hypothetical protein SAMD00019534_016000 [Acytostelium subglobosum LB1]GAM18425.1 hypothetical protein SAMD00019534_016000 [Acytostelium subglobosum LB1]|eukprot:XP_012757645.1 hypothetical protein SAMD00019534_016000 [Acytostelium subglobosum LB1]